MRRTCVERNRDLKDAFEGSRTFRGGFMIFNAITCLIGSYSYIYAYTYLFICLSIRV